MGALLWLAPFDPPVYFAAKHGHCHHPRVGRELGPEPGR